MPSYLKTLNKTQLTNLNLIITRMPQKGITNPFTQAGILAVVSKESTFVPKSEKGYAGTSNDRIRKIFSSLKSLPEDELSALKSDDKNFFDNIYGGRYGNATDEGYKYRGRGFNQLTFKNNYKSMTRYTETDIVVNPDEMNKVEVAADALIGYFKRAFSSSRGRLSDYNMTGINGVQTTKDAVGAAYHANAGWGKSMADILADPTGGRKKAVERVDEFYAFITRAGKSSPITLPARGYYKKGDKGPGVEKIQHALAKAGFWTYHKFTEYYGVVTEKAIQEFQMTKGLNKDGLVGSKTMGLLFGISV